MGRIVFGSKEALEVVRSSKKLNITKYEELKRGQRCVCKRTPSKFSVVAVFDDWNIVKCGQCGKEFKQKKTSPKVEKK